LNLSFSCFYLSSAGITGTCQSAWHKSNSFHFVWLTPFCDVPSFNSLTCLSFVVRLCSDRISLIKECISQSPTCYKQSVKLLGLAELLKVAGNSFECYAADCFCVIFDICVNKRTSVHRCQKSIF
jgi:hypothetical protein